MIVTRKDIESADGQEKIMDYIDNCRERGAVNDLSLFAYQLLRVAAEEKSGDELADTSSVQGCEVCASAGVIHGDYGSCQCYACRGEGYVVA